MSEKLPVFNKLDHGGDFYRWEVEIKTYFESIGLWDHVLENAEIEPNEGDAEDADMLAAKCRRILIHSLDKRIHPSTQHLRNANDMFTRVKKLFVGTPAAMVRELRRQLGKVKFEGCYFTYLTSYFNLVYQLDNEDGVLS